MDQYSMLTLDLNDDVSADNRNKFYSELEARQWHKVRNLTTLWYAEWKVGATEEGIIHTTKKDVADAAKNAGVGSYDAALAICGKPIVWKC